VDIREVWQEVCLKLVDHGFLTRLPGRGRIETIALSYELLSNPIWPMPQARETLRALNEAGFPLGIVSNAQFFTPLLFEALLEVGPPELGFREELCAFSYRECRAKPSPEIFSGPLSALERSYGIDAAHTLYVGNDMKNDVLAASKTGLRTCLFAGDRRSLRLRTDDPEAAGIRPDAVVTTLGELPTVLSIGGGEHAQTSH
jgi:putative hydrolase of the HAD superfamily